jgi:hypothetical protein
MGLIPFLLAEFGLRKTVSFIAKDVILVQICSYKGEKKFHFTAGLYA